MFLQFYLLCLGLSAIWTAGVIHKGFEVKSIKRLLETSFTGFSSEYIKDLIILILAIISIIPFVNLISAKGGFMFIFRGFKFKNQNIEE